MQAGKLRLRVTIEQPAAGVDSLGQPDGYTTFAAGVPAQIQDLQGKELAVAQSFADQATHRVVIRFLPGVKGKMRVRFEDRVFEIQAVLQPDNKRIEHHLLCLERSNA